MKKRQNNSNPATALQITFSFALLSLFAILPASTFKAAASGAPGGPQLLLPFTVKVSLPIDSFDTSMALTTVIIEPVTTTYIDPARTNYIGFQGDFLFDSTVVSFAIPPVRTAGLTATGWNITGNIINTGPGTLKTLRVSAFSLDGVTPLSGAGTLFEMRMLRVSSTRGATSRLVWQAFPNDFEFIDTDLNSFSPCQDNGRITIMTAAPETEVAVVGGNLLVTGSAAPDTLTISRIASSTDFLISDSVRTLRAGPGTIPVTVNSVQVAAVAGYIEVDTLGGNDQLTIDFINGNFIPPGGLNYNGGDQTGPSPPLGDTLVINGAGQGKANYSMIGCGMRDGTIFLQNFGTVNYTGLEPIVNTGTNSDIEFNLPDAGPNAATLGDDNMPGNGMSRLSGATFESVDFTNPTGSVTINRGDPGDTLTVTDLPDFNRSLIIGSSANPFSAISFTGDLPIVINGTTAVSQYTQFNASGPVDLTGANLILSGSYVPTGGESFTIIENDSTDAITGTFTGLPEGAVISNLLGSGLNATISYLGGTGNDAVITVASPTPGPKTISGNVYQCAGATNNALAGATMTLTGASAGSTLSDGSGVYSFTGLAASGTYTVTPSKAARPPGSVGINTMDVLAAQRHYLGITLIPPGCRLTAADCTAPFGTINTNDVLAIQRFFIGRTFGTGNVGTYGFTPVNRSYASLGNDQAGQNFDTVVFGDCAPAFANPRPGGPGSDAAGDGTNGGEIPSTVAAVALPNVALDQLRKSSRAESTNTFVAAVTTSAIDENNKLVGFQGDVTFDERVVTFQSEPVQKAGITAGNWNVSGNVLPGKGPMRTLRISAYSEDFTPLSGSGTLFELRMRTVSDSALRIPHSAFPLVWAAPPNHFIFIDANLGIQQPGNALPGNTTN